MKNRLLLSITLLSLMALTFACGGSTTNVNVSSPNRANTAPNSNSTTNTMANSVSSMANTVSNMASNAVNSVANMVSNKAANANTAKTDTNKAANKVATSKPPKGSTFECNDGSFSDAKTSQGACSGHNGVKKAIK